MPLTIALASDHAAVELRAALCAWLSDEGHGVLDLGTAAGVPIDYPDAGRRLAAAISGGTADFGVALCGSGIGISMAVNRDPGCRCALVAEPVSARLAREHNDANVIAMGARMIGTGMAVECLAAFLAASFAGGRHEARVAKLSCSSEEPVS